MSLEFKSKATTISKKVVSDIIISQLDKKYLSYQALGQNVDLNRIDVQKC